MYKGHHCNYINNIENYKQLKGWYNKLWKSIWYGS